MTHRFLVYPLLLLAWMQLLPLLRRDWRWHLATILQLAAVLVFGGVALLSRDGARWVALSWGTFVLLHITPRLLLAGSARYRQQGRWRRAAPLEDLAGWLMLGEMGRLRRRYATALRAMAGGASELAVEMLRDAESPTMPTAARGLVRAWRLAFLLHRREWMAAVVLFQDTPEWGSAAVTIFVRLQIARAFAELDDLPRAMRCLQFVMLAPSVMSLEEPLWAMRIRLAAMAGDTTEVDRLLGDRRRQRRGFARFAAYWRGRAALAKGDKTTALGQLSRAYAITDPRDLAWQQAIGHYLKLVESPIYVPPAVSPEYQQELAGLRLAEEQSRPWRDLIGLRRPTPVVAILLAEISLVFAAQQLLPVPWPDRLVMWGGNGMFTIHFGQWWRLVTVMLLHGGWLHFLMNGFALWSFGSSIERAWGWWRMLLVFVIGGAVGNLASAMLERYDIAVGASAGIFALLGAYAVALWQIRHPLYLAMRTRLLRVLVVLVAIDFTIGWLEPQIDNLAHLGGFVAGLGLAALLCPRRRDSIMPPT